MPKSQDDERYTPCWAIVPISGHDGPPANGEPEDEESSHPIEHVLFWLAIAWGAVGIYVLVKELF